MIVNWTEERMKVIPVIPTEKITAIDLGGKDQVILYPGYNNIPDKIFEAIKPHIADDIALRRIKLASVPVKDGAKGEIKAIPVKEVPLAKLKDMVKKCVNLESLRTWLDAESRPDARLVIQKRIDEVEEELKKGGQSTETDSSASDDGEGEE